jgi:nicotinate-nucleotide adenylyltransferase
LQNHAIYVYPRISSEPENLELKNHPKVQLINAPIVEISSTFIRNNIKEGKNIQPLLPLRFGYIDHNNFTKVITPIPFQFCFNNLKAAVNYHFTR